MMELYLRNGAVVIVKRPWWFGLNETKGFHHFLFLHSADPLCATLHGKRVAVPLSDIQYLVFI